MICIGTDVLTANVRCHQTDPTPIQLGSIGRDGVFRSVQRYTCCISIHVASVYLLHLYTCCVSIPVVLCLVSGGVSY
jgi:hypothetical protein